MAESEQPVPEVENPADDEPGSHTGVRVAIATLFLPAALVLLLGLRPDDTAAASMRESIDDTLFVLAVLVAIAGGGAAAVWSNRDRPDRRVALMLVFTLVGWCLGFLGAIAVAVARHPTWDDA